MENGKKINLRPEDADLDSLSQLFPDNENFTVDDLAFQPQFQSTPVPRIQPRKKKQKLTIGTTQDSDSQGNFKGEVIFLINNK